MRTLIHGGTVVTAAGRRRADVLVSGERIEALVSGAEGGAASPAGQRPVDRAIDARGKLVMPGGIDAHTHLDMPFGGIRTADDFESGTRAAACGGTTTIIDYATQARGGTLRQALADWRSRAEGKAVVDYGFHMSLSDLRPDVEIEMAALADEGVTSFKLFMAYPGRLMLDDGEIFRAMRRAAASGALVCVHAENGPVIDVLVREALASGDWHPRSHALTRPALLEAEAVHRAVALAALAGSSLYIVHVSSGEALSEIAAARRQGRRVFGETCPQYLFLEEGAYEAPWPGGRGVIMSPPLRPAGNRDALWSGLAGGDLQVVATDHCPFLERDKLRAPDFASVPNGAPGIEARVALLYDGGVRAGRLSPERFVEVMATGPARLFGLYPRKGSLEPGADADILVFDPEGRTELSASAGHGGSDYSPYEGRVLKGAVDTVLSRGEVVVEGGRFVGHAGRGRYLARTRFTVDG